MKAQQHIQEIESLHRFARERFKLSKSDATLQAAYLAEVTTQLLKASVDSEAEKPAKASKSKARIKAKA
jgi:hypothetical protein